MCSCFFFLDGVPFMAKRSKNVITPHFFEMTVYGPGEKNNLTFGIFKLREKITGASPDPLLQKNL